MNVLEHFSCTVNAELKNLPGILDALATFMASSGWEFDEISDAALATDEAVTNIIMHGYRESDGPIRLFFESTRKELTVTIEDEAPPYDPTKHIPRDITGDLDSRSEGGLGIILIRNVMDAVSYEHRDGRNIFTMKKNRK